MIPMFKAPARPLALLVVASLLGAAAPAWAGGFGLALETEWTNSDISDAIPFNEGRVNRDFDQWMGGIGFSYDTNVAADELVNYRMKVGYRVGRRTYDDKRTFNVPRRVESVDPDQETLVVDQDEETVNAFTLHQTVGFGFVRNERFRVWAGPSVRLNVDWYTPTTDLDVVNVAIGMGPEIGVNYHVSDRLSLSLSASYNYMYLSESLELTGPDTRFDGGQHMAALALTFFWRTVDDTFDTDPEW